MSEFELPDELQIKVLSSFEDAGPVWRRIESRAACYVYQHYDWLNNWFTFVGRHLKLETSLVCVEDGSGRPLLVLPLAVEQRGPFRCLTWLGGALTDYNAPLVDPVFSNKLSRKQFETIWSRIEALLPSYDVIHFERQPDLIDGAKNPLLYLPCEIGEATAHNFLVRGNWRDYYHSRTSTKMRSTDRRNERRLAELGELEFSVVREPGDAAPIVEKMIAQKSIQYDRSGARNIFREAGHREFHHFCAEQFCDGLLVHLSTLKAGSEILAIHWGMTFGRRFYHFMPTYDRSAYAKFSPGRLLLLKLMEWSFENQIEVFDFTVGNDVYKKDWCDKELKLYDCILPITSL
ncbi:MAG: GNAT family N-acetyltransferase, partial [Proteobacteria bacterium]|nr:GNAT family N-acetyltransferase [Pseudomonadota bacterium]